MQPVVSEKPRGHANGRHYRPTCPVCKPWTTVVQEAPIALVPKGKQHPFHAGYNGHDSVTTIRGW